MLLLTAGQVSDYRSAIVTVLGHNPDMIDVLVPWR